MDETIRKLERELERQGLKPYVVYSEVLFGPERDSAWFQDRETERQKAFDAFHSSLQDERPEAHQFTEEEMQRLKTWRTENGEDLADHLVKKEGFFRMKAKRVL